MSYNTLNYTEQGGAVTVINGELRIGATGRITANGTQATAITPLTDNSGGTAGDTIADVPGTYTEATLANQIASLTAKINQLIAAVNGSGITE